MPRLKAKVLVLVRMMVAGVFAASFAGYRTVRQLHGQSNPGTYTFEITEVQYYGFTGKSTVTIRAEPNESTSDMEGIKQRALSEMEMHAGLGSSNNFVIGYLAPDTVDSQAVDRDSVIKELPRPRFWRDEKDHWSRGRNCNVMVKATLDLSGKVSNVTRVNDRPVLCDKESDVIEAAQNIKFDPATRNGITVSQRQLFFYRLH